MRVIIFGLVFISPPFLKKILLRWFCKAIIDRRAQIGWFSALVGEEISLGAYSIIRPLTLINLSGNIRLAAYSEISSFCLIYGSSSLTVGKGSYIGPQSLINVESEVVIGSGSAIGARAMIFTHGSFLPYTEGYFIKLDGVRLGDKVWCAAGVFISPGVEIGDNSFVNSGSVVTQSIPEGSVAEGNPARVVYPMERVKRSMTPRHVDLALERIIKDYVDLCLTRDFKVVLKEQSRNRLLFQTRGADYRIEIIPSTAKAEDQELFTQRTKRILIINHPSWQPVEQSLSFDMQTMQTAFSKDPIHESLRIFMLRYFGLRFTDKNLL